MLIREEKSGKYIIAVYEKDHYVFVDRNEKTLWNPWPSKVELTNGWPIKIYKTKTGTSRNLTQVELNKILFSADLLDGNKEYFAHASEYPKQKIGKIGENNIMTDTKIETTPTQKPEKDQTIIIEPVPQPVQEWRACGACGGMGTMGCDNCGGSGTKYIGDRLHRCSRCNGRGIIPCKSCFGNKGQYITVYR